MGADLGYNFSYTWRTLMACKQVFNLGACRHVSDGSSIKINNTNLILSLFGTNVQPLGGSFHNAARVCELMHIGLPVRNSQLVVSAFDPHVIATIYEISLPRVVIVDAWF